jgi:hypothetical protein
MAGSTTTYLTNKNSLIAIPTPIIKVNPAVSGLYNEQAFLTASYLPFSSIVPEEFKAHNPKFYLFRSKSRSAKKVKTIDGLDSYRKIVPKGFYHPTHLNGINFPPNTPIYGGQHTRIPFNTEYDFGGVTPYNYTVLGFNPYEWVEYTLNDGAWLPMTVAQWGLYDLGNYRFTGKQSVGSRSTLFKIAIGINNPSGSTTNPILFGDFSPTFRLQFLTARTRTGLAFTPIRFVIQLENSTVKRKVVTL